MKLNLSEIHHRTYAFLDPASGKKLQGQTVKRIRARSAIVVIYLDSLYRIFILATWADRVSPSRVRDKVLEVNRQFRPRIFGIEASAQQFLFADLVGEEARRLGERFNLAPIDQPTNVVKDDRIRTTLEPAITEGRLFIQHSQIELQQELEGFPTARTKDLVDALASAINLAPKPRPRQVIDDEANELASYLRSCGFPPAKIADRISHLRQADGILARS